MTSNRLSSLLQKEYFLFLLPLFFVLHGYMETYPLVSLQDCLVLLLRYLLAVTLLCGLLFLFLRNFRKAAVLGFYILAFHFFFGVIHDLLKPILPNSFFVRYTFLIPLSLLGLVAIIIFFKRSRSRFNRLTLYFNEVLLVLIIIDIFMVIVKTINVPSPDASVPAGFVSCDSCDQPDVYLIVADEYAGRQELQDIFKFDNQPFESALQQRGFHIVDSSVSNYNYTPFSVASMLTMDYLTGIEGRNQSKKDRAICYELINENVTTRFFRSQGYEIINLSVFQLAGRLPVAPSNFILTGKDRITSSTFLSRLDRDIRFNLVTRYRIPSELRNLRDYHESSLNTLFRKTKEAATSKNGKPRFIYTHLMLPHYPYLYDSSGKETAPEMVIEGYQVDQAAYIGFLQYSNKKYLELIDHILASAPRPPVIILMGDHGFRHFTEKVEDRYHFMNLNAVYLPEGGYERFYPGMSAVNQMRVILNTAFRQQLPLLKDSTSLLIE